MPTSQVSPIAMQESDVLDELPDWSAIFIHLLGMVRSMVSAGTCAVVFERRFFAIIRAV